MSVARQRVLRADPTPAERAMWRLLRAFREQGYHFRRQVQLGSYYVDFACHHARVVIEVDGDTHAVGEGPAMDAARDAYLRKRGFQVVRFTNLDVLKNQEGVFDELGRVLTSVPSGAVAPTPTRVPSGAVAPTPTLDPSPQGGGRRRAQPPVGREES